MIIYKLLTLLILTIIFLFLRILFRFTYIIENIYSRFFYKNISLVLSKISSIFPFSLSEILIPILISLIIFFIVKNYKNIITSIKLSPLYFAFNSLFIIIATILIVIIIFTTFWGLNYYRKPLLSYQKEDYSLSEENLLKLAYILSGEANLLKKEITENNINYTTSKINDIVYGEYKNVFNEYPFLEMHYSKAKPIGVSELFLYFNISGIYSPFTSEANFNKLVPQFSMPFVISHEMSHQIGIAYEDEANFLAYISCYNSNDKYMNYSAAFMGLLYVMSALDKNDAYKQFLSSINEDVINDIKYYYSFWKKYDKPISTVASKINDTYLKANNQKDGVKSYSRVVRLLAYYRSKNNIENNFYKAN